ncbi:MAG: TolC family protein [Thermoanaerobaculales bacterium]|jgi:outer membrane protein|nr:TolC family protein [Thermoanaerobaculales bacterium]
MHRRKPAARAALLMLILITSPMASQAESAGKTTLKELVLSALATHERVEIADSEIRRAQADKKLARSAIMPRLELNGNYTFYADEQTLELAPGEEFVIRPAEDWGWSADLRQTLFYGLRPWRARDIAKLNLDIAELDRRITVNDLTLEVAAGFFTATAAEQRVEVRAVALEQIEKQLHVAKRRYEVGESTIADVARWRSEVAAAKQALVIAEGEAQLARHRLGRLVGMSSLGELVRNGPIPAPEGDEEALMATALTERLEIQTLVNQLEAAGLWVKLEKGAWLPELEASGQYFQQKAAFPSSDWASLTFSLKVPIYDGGVTSANVAKAKEDLRQVELLGRTLRRGIEDQVDTASIGFRAADATLDAAGERSKAAMEAYRQVEAAFRVGEASSVDLLDATTEATDAETAHIIARAQREFQAISLRHAVGLAPLPDLDYAAIEPGTEE